MSFKDKTQIWDAIYGFPRPANEQYLSSYKTFLRLSQDVFTGGLSLFFALASAGLTVYSYHYAAYTFNLQYKAGLGALIGLLIIVILFFVGLMFVLDVFGLMLPYRLEFQRESHGGRTWATVSDLAKEDVDAVRPADADITGKGVFLAPFKRSLLSSAAASHQVFLSLKRMSQAIIIYGPPGSGKSSTFFIPVIRQFASCGGAIVLDVKGELYNYTAHYYGNVYRIDIMDPLNSDWFDLFGGCYRNPDLARRIASYLVGYDPNKSNSKEPIWDQSAVSMLSIIILLLCEQKEYPTPRDILRFLAQNPIKASRFNPKINKNSPYSPLTEAFEQCANTFARDIWLNNFAKMPEDTFGSVKFNVDTALTQLLSPKVNEILRPPTQKERLMGRRRIDFTNLREMFDFDVKKSKKRGTAIYVVVSPSDSINMDVFLRVIFSVALDTLREKAKTGTNVLVALDEAGNVPLSKLPEGINTDRAVGICYFLGYQDKNQPVAQYGREAANSFLGTSGVNIFLPGVDDDTADLASKRIGETTILQRSSSDAKNDGLDSEKLSEAGRKLILPQDLTAMRWFTQCVITIKGAAPIRTKIPPDSKIQDTRISQPRRIVDKVSEEVLRLLEIIKGRDNETVLPVEHQPAQFETTRPKDIPVEPFVPQKIYFPAAPAASDDAGSPPLPTNFAHSKGILPMSADEELPLTARQQENNNEAVRSPADDFDDLTKVYSEDAAGGRNGGAGDNVIFLTPEGSLIDVEPITSLVGEGDLRRRRKNRQK